MTYFATDKKKSFYILSQMITVGPGVGFQVGAGVGERVGFFVGAGVGTFVGAGVGALVGFFVGANVVGDGAIIKPKHNTHIFFIFCFYAKTNKKNQKKNKKKNQKLVVLTHYPWI